MEKRGKEIERGKYGGKRGKSVGKFWERGRNVGVSGGKRRNGGIWGQVGPNWEQIG